MSVVVEIINQSKLEKAKDLLGAKTENETIEIALDITIEKFASKQKSNNDLPEDFFEDLFSEETNLSDGESVQAVINERGEYQNEVENMAETIVENKTENTYGITPEMRREARKKLEQMIREKGLKAAKTKGELYGPETGQSQEEIQAEVDEFLQMLRGWRNEDSDRSLD